MDAKTFHEQTEKDRKRLHRFVRRLAPIEGKRAGDFSEWWARALFKKWFGSHKSINSSRKLLLDEALMQTHSEKSPDIIVTASPPNPSARIPTESIELLVEVTKKLVFEKYFRDTEKWSQVAKKLHGKQPFTRVLFAFDGPDPKTLRDWGLRWDKPLPWEQARFDIIFVGTRNGGTERGWMFIQRTPATENLFEFLDTGAMVCDAQPPLRDFIASMQHPLEIDHPISRKGYVFTRNDQPPRPSIRVTKPTDPYTGLAEVKIRWPFQPPHVE